MKHLLLILFGILCLVSCDLAYDTYTEPIRVEIGPYYRPYYEPIYRPIPIRPQMRPQPIRPQHNFGHRK